MRRTVHSFCLIEDQVLTLGWHRYTDAGEQLPGGYTGNTAPTGISPQEFDQLFPKSPLLTDCMATLREQARAIVAEHEGHTWAAYGVDGVEISKVYANIPRWRYGLAYDEANPPDMEIRWRRLRDGQPLPAWCDGVLLLEHFTGQDGEQATRVNANKGIIKSAPLYKRLVAMLQCCAPVVEALDKGYGIRDAQEEAEVMAR